MQWRFNARYRVHIVTAPPSGVSSPSYPAALLLATCRCPRCLQAGTSLRCRAWRHPAALFGAATHIDRVAGIGYAGRTVKTDMEQRLLEIHRRLHERFGPQHWWLADGPFEVIVGAILTQSTSWVNVSLALANLKQAGCLNPPALAALSQAELAALIRPSGYYNQKAHKVRAFLDLLWHAFDGDLQRLFALETLELRRVLLATHGIGEETADSIILYAAGKPVFVVDAYTRRLFARLGLCAPAGSYAELQSVFAPLPPKATLFNEYHALIVRQAKVICCKREPQCAVCPLLDICPTGQSRWQDVV